MLFLAQAAFLLTILAFLLQLYLHQQVCQDHFEDEIFGKKNFPFFTLKLFYMFLKVKDKLLV